MTSKLINLSSMCIISLIRPHFQLPKIDIASGWSFLRVWESMTIAFFFVVVVIVSVYLVNRSILQFSKAQMFINLQTHNKYMYASFSNQYYII